MRKMITLNQFLRREARKLQKELASLNEFKHRPRFEVNYDLKRYGICQEIIDCVDAGGDASALISANIAKEIEAHKVWLKQAKATNNFTNAAPFYWTDVGMIFVVAARLASGELTEGKVEEINREAMEERYRDAV